MSASSPGYSSLFPAGGGSLTSSGGSLTSSLISSPPRSDPGPSSFSGTPASAAPLITSAPSSLCDESSSPEFAPVEFWSGLGPPSGSGSLDLLRVLDGIVVPVFRPRWMF